MPTTQRSIRAALTSAVLATVLSLAMVGCSGDDIGFNGKIFDALGANGSKTHAAEPKMVARSPLVVPPGLERLPEPGEPAAAEPTELAALNDPEKLARQKKADLANQQAEYCKQNYEMPKLRGNKDVEEVEGPLGPCRASFASSWENWNKPAKQEGQVDE